MDADEYLSLKNEVVKMFPEFVLENDVHSVLDQLLKSLVQEESVISNKSSILYFLESKSSLLCEEIGDVELILSTLKNIFKNSSGNQEMQGQCLITCATILLEASEKFSGAELDGLLSQLVNMLLELINEVNSSNNPYVRSVAADCLIEIELCFPMLLKPCLDNIYGVTVKEMSIAHQQYTSLLSLLMKHSAGNSQVGTPLWNTYPQVVFESKFLKGNSSAQYNSQLVSFLVDELPYCTSEGVMWITNHIVDMLLHNRELRASCQVLKPLFFSSIYTFNCAVFHLLLYLERAFGRELFEDEEHNLILNQLLLNSSHPSLSKSIRLLYLELLNDYLSRSCNQLKCIPDIHVILPNRRDDPDVQLKKFILLSNNLKHKNGSSEFLLKVADNIRKGIRFDKTTKCKSVFIKSLYKLINDYEDASNEVIVRLIISASVEDVTVVPFVLCFVKQVQKTFPTSPLPTLILSSLVHVFTQTKEFATEKTLSFVVDVFQDSVFSNCSLNCLMSILIYIDKHVLSHIVSKSLSWVLGHKILKLCCTMMKEYNTSSLFNELSNVLQGFVLKFDNDDVQDRANLYLCLLRTLSDKKLKTVLQGPRQVLSCVLPDEITFQIQSCFQKLDKPIVHLSKIKNSVSFDETFKYLEGSSEDLITAYKNFISHNPLCKRLVMKISLNLAQEYKYLTCIEALVVFLDSPQNWGEVDPVIVGYFKEDSASLHQGTLLYDVVLHPVSPQPTEVQVRAEFCLENICHVCFLEPFTIEFTDLFCVLPVCEKVIQTNDFFESLWKSLEADYHSVIMLEYPENVMKELVREKLGVFIVEEDSRECHVAIYLPPEYHLLMRFIFQPENTIVKLVTDYLYILSLTNVFFLKEFA